MRFRFALVALAAVAMVLPITGASATHCDVPIFVFSQTRVQTDIDDPTNPGTPIGRTAPSVTSSAVGCTVVRDTVLGSEDPTTHPLTETDILYPGSNRLSVRLLDNGNDPSIIASATLDFAGTSYPLTMVAGIDVTGAPATWLDSQRIEIDPLLTLAPNTAVATFTLTDTSVYSRTYKTVA